MRSAEFAVEQLAQSMLTLISIGGAAELASLQKLHSDVLEDWDEPNSISIAIEAIMSGMKDA